MTSQGGARMRALIAATILVAIFGAGKWAFDRHGGSSAAGGPSGAINPYSAQAVAQMQDMLAQQVEVARQGVALDAAAPSQSLPQMRVLQETATEIHLALILPDGQSVDQIIALQPDQHYQPTAAEATALRQQSRQVFGATFKVENLPEGERVVLSYVIPSTALPTELRERLYGKIADTAAIHIFNTAWAQSANMGFWTGVQTSSQVGKSFEWGSAVKGARKIKNNAEKVSHALDTSDQFSKWMAALDSLDDCARHPTQTVTQTAYKQDPGYQQRTIDAIGQARSEVQQAAGLSYVNQEANVAMQLTKAPKLASKLGKAMYSWNDSALTEIGNGLVADASKLVDCDPAPPPRESGDGTITYHLHREGFWGIDVDDQLVKATVTISAPPVMPPPGIVAFNLRGQGEFKGKIVSKQSNACAGVAEITGDGSDKYLHVTGGAASGSCNGIDFAYGGRNANFTCDFGGVDPVNGGKYEVQAAGEFGPWTECTLDLTRRHK
jgi:hypothetical protein